MSLVNRLEFCLVVLLVGCVVTTVAQTCSADETQTRNQNTNNACLKVCEVDVFNAPQIDRTYSSSQVSSTSSMLDSDGGWIANTNLDQWIQMDLGSSKAVQGLVTQNQKGVMYRIKTLSVEHKETASGAWQSIPGIFNANLGYAANEKQYMYFPPVKARYVKVSVVTWDTHPAGRIAVLLCRNCAVPTINGASTDCTEGTDAIAGPLTTETCTWTADASFSCTDIGLSRCFDGSFTKTPVCVATSCTETTATGYATCKAGSSCAAQCADGYGGPAPTAKCLVGGSSFVMSGCTWGTTSNALATAPVVVVNALFCFVVLLFGF